MKYTKIVGLVIVLMLSSWKLKAQNDLVRLQDGSVIRGTIIEYIVGDHLRIKTEEGKVFEYKSSEVSRTTVGGKLNTAIKDHGFYNLTYLGLAVGNGDYSPTVSPGMYTVNGWKWNSRWMTGLGLGLEWLDQGGKLPIFADVRYRINKGNFTPFIGAMAGYNLTLNKEDNIRYYDLWNAPDRRNYGGITGGIQFGFMSSLGEHLGLTGALGYRYQRLRSTYDEYYWSNAGTIGGYITVPTTERKELHRITMSFGLLFD